MDPADAWTVKESRHLVLTKAHMSRAAVGLTSNVPTDEVKPIVADNDQSAASGSL